MGPHNTGLILYCQLSVTPLWVYHCFQKNVLLWENYHKANKVYKFACSSFFNAFQETKQDEDIYANVSSSTEKSHQLQSKTCGDKAIYTINLEHTFKKNLSNEDIYANCWSEKWNILNNLSWITTERLVYFLYASSDHFNKHQHM